MTGPTSTSDEQMQSSGISQGCPLSPFLFVAIMSVVVHDTSLNLSGAALEQMGRSDLDVILHAEDTLLTGSDGGSLQELLDNIAQTGALYGMELHWPKFQFISIGKRYHLKTPRR